MLNRLQKKSKRIMDLKGTVAGNLREALSPIFFSNKSEGGKDYTCVESSSPTLLGESGKECGCSFIPST